MMPSLIAAISVFAINMPSRKLVAVASALVACAVALTAAQAQPALLGCPGGPWCPVWVNCSYSEAPGASCHDCSTRVICTPVGGLLRPCLVPWLKHCVNGQCRSSPSAECSTGPPTEAPTEPPTEAVTIPAEAPADTPAEAPVESPAEAPVESPAEAPFESPAEAPAKDADTAPEEPKSPVQA